MTSPTSASRDTDYRDVAKDVYAEAAQSPDATLCCVSGSEWRLPGLVVPDIMYRMNYGCGTTVSPEDLGGDGTVLYIGVGGGLEALQFAYFRRRPGGVIAVDPVGEMRDKARANLEEASRLNPWFRPEFVDIRDGDAGALPVEDASVAVVAQNCLFNIFQEDHLEKALAEVHRVLKCGGRFSTSDPITPRVLPESLKNNAVLRARCLSGCLTYEDYLETLSTAGLKRIVVRARRPYRYLLPTEFPELDGDILLESLEVVAIKSSGDQGRSEIHTGRTVAYIGGEESLTLEGMAFPRGVPIPVSDRRAEQLAARDDFQGTGPTYFTKAAGCC